MYPYTFESFSIDIFTVPTGFFKDFNTILVNN